MYVTQFLVKKKLLDAKHSKYITVPSNSRYPNTTECRVIGHNDSLSN